MAVVCSELQEDYFLASIGSGVFTDTETDTASEDIGYAETTFDIASCTGLGGPGPWAITLEHCASSTRDLVGLQLWRGAFLLADFLLSQPSLVSGRKVLELAAGTGLTAVTAGMMADAVTATDVDRGDILALLGRNGDRNKGSMASCKWQVKEMDFFWDTWTEDMETIVCDSQVVLAADVVYDRDITKHFFKTLRKILTYAPKVVFIAIEKRQRTSCDGALEAPNFEYFLENLSLLHSSKPKENVTVKVSEEDTKFSKYFNYTRVEELTLWKIESDLT
eukprot:GFUD01016270.1.p1 GENE.GFUD01016270.1~~GFUD01016270.1.p1  ORF type:complete len:296 (+),score=88.09 GFUD01016270.1:56-889(+)